MTDPNTEGPPDVPGDPEDDNITDFELPDDVKAAWAVNQAEDDEPADDPEGAPDGSQAG